MIKIGSITLPQLMIAIATVGGIFLGDITNDLLALGIDGHLINIVSKLLTAVVGLAAFLKTGGE